MGVVSSIEFFWSNMANPAMGVERECHSTHAHVPPPPSLALSALQLPGTTRTRPICPRGRTKRVRMVLAFLFHHDA
jgi:hypothetical protein